MNIEATSGAAPTVTPFEIPGEPRVYVVEWETCRISVVLDPDALHELIARAIVALSEPASTGGQRPSRANGPRRRCGRRASPCPRPAYWHECKGLGVAPEGHGLTGRRSRMRRATRRSRGARSGTAAPEAQRLRAWRRSLPSGSVHPRLGQRQHAGEHSEPRHGRRRREPSRLAWLDRLARNGSRAASTWQDEPPVLGRRCTRTSVDRRSTQRFGLAVWRAGMTLQSTFVPFIVATICHAATQAGTICQGTGRQSDRQSVGRRPSLRSDRA